MISNDNLGGAQELYLKPKSLFEGTMIYERVKLKPQKSLDGSANVGSDLAGEDAQRGAYDDYY